MRASGGLKDNDISRVDEVPDDGLIGVTNKIERWLESAGYDVFAISNKYSLYKDESESG